MRSNRILIELTVSLFLWSYLVHSPTAKAASPENLLSLDTQNQETITITSDRAELSNKEYTAIYRDNVVVKRGDVTLYSAEIKTWFDNDSKRIKQIKATGGVKLVQADIIITAEAATYYEEQQKIVLTGKPMCKKGANVLTGSDITYFMDTGKIVVQDAKSTLQPKTDLKANSLATGP